MTSNKIQPRHLERRAVVYLRQSSQKQVQRNQESQRLQYSLADRARAFGWREVEVIDCDLGSSAAIGAAQREGFDRLIASVAVGEVGIVLSREVSRLSRRDKDWCQLLEVCQLFGTLIGDVEQVYDLTLLDDQLVLGIKGTMSVVELKVLQMRMSAGMESKARRGELKRLLPPGYVYDAMGKVAPDPDRRIREAMDLLFARFRELWSIRQTFLWFQTEGLELPVNKRRGAAMRVVWQLPTYQFIKSVLQNPFYAGVYFWGRRPTQIAFEDGRLRKRCMSVREPEQCKVFLPDHHPGYIDWATFEENLRMIRANSLKCESDASVSAVRAGQGVLVGVLRCGHCGRKLHVRYWGKSGTAARYLCKGDYHAGGRYCVAFGGGMVDRRFSRELLNVLSPLGLRGALAALDRLRVADEGQAQALQRQVEQMDYEAARAFEQYNEVDPRNRLVAAELERRWNAKLEELGKLRASVKQLEEQTPALSEEHKAQILALGERIPHVWESAHCPPETKKKIIRTVIEEVIVTLDAQTDELRFIIHWKGGTHTEFKMPKPKSGVGHKTSAEDLEVIRRMAVRYGDDDIARVLNKLGRRTATDKRWNEQRVAVARQRHGIAGQQRTIADPDILTQGQAVKYCGVSNLTIQKLVRAGIVKMEQVVPWAPWEIKRSDLDSKEVQAILDRVRKTGKLVLQGVGAAAQGDLFQQ
jgi:DNA invertase Pin-like site-specific DNA recombinase